MRSSAKKVKSQQIFCDNYMHDNCDSVIMDKPPTDGEVEVKKEEKFAG